MTNKKLLLEKLDQSIKTGWRKLSKRQKKAVKYFERKIEACTVKKKR